MTKLSKMLLAGYIAVSNKKLFNTKGEVTSKISSAIDSLRTEVSSTISDKISDLVSLSYLTGLLDKKADKLQLDSKAEVSELETKADSATLTEAIATLNSTITSAKNSAISTSRVYTDGKPGLNTKLIYITEGDIPTAPEEVWMSEIDIFNSFKDNSLGYYKSENGTGHNPDGTPAKDGWYRKLGNEWTPLILNEELGGGGEVTSMISSSAERVKESPTARIEFKYGGGYKGGGRNNRCEFSTDCKLYGFYENSKKTIWFYGTEDDLLAKTNSLSNIVFDTNVKAFKISSWSSKPEILVLLDNGYMKHFTTDSNRTTIIDNTTEAFGSSGFRVNSSLTDSSSAVRILVGSSGSDIFKSFHIVGATGHRYSLTKFSYYYYKDNDGHVEKKLVLNDTEINDYYFGDFNKVLGGVLLMGGSDRSTIMQIPGDKQKLIFLKASGEKHYKGEVPIELPVGFFNKNGNYHDGIAGLACVKIKQGVIRLFAHRDGDGSQSGSIITLYEENGSWIQHPYIFCFNDIEGVDDGGGWGTYLGTDPSFYGKTVVVFPDNLDKGGIATVKFTE